ncbi:MULTISPECIES: hypothetical protein [Cyanophyceae]|uniref:hypothetical protein n=1 Tax=Cyanophyceae TaxID=3028117 RepID=UPI00168988A6|nr:MULTISPECIES: hypothetical protein [Cyanophyceae]MBD1917974.1 hypothetical protein [Phormidium sp. FACHB-77]MBD2029222.1 hypothetical protein [Phormidium sp. FACHB-322]MBD2049754.1 hypothetical protein [Leptolyngbya sp. FACHB-60]
MAIQDENSMRVELDQDSLGSVALSYPYQVRILSQSPMTSRNLLARKGIKITLIILMSVGLTIASLRYKQPAHCETLCRDAQFCQIGQCRFGEQKAGFPLPFVQDAEANSPTSGWGKVGLEDYIYGSLGAFALNVAFYSLTLWLFQRSLKWLFSSFQA